MHTNQALADSIKQEVLADLEQSRIMADTIKRDILAQIEAQQETWNTWNNAQNRNMYSQPAANGTYVQSGAGMQRLSPMEAERIKQEVLMDIQSELAGTSNMYAPQWNTMRPQNTAYDMNTYNSPSIRRIRSDVRKELQAMKTNKGMSTTSDPYIRSLAHSIVEEARDEGMTIDDVIRTLDGQNTTMGWTQRMTSWVNRGQNRGFIYGIGATLLAFFLIPILTRNFRSVAVKSMEGGMSVADKAKYGMSKTKDEIQDIITEAKQANQQKSANPASMDVDYDLDEYNDQNDDLDTH